jgi:hypothetical protein
MTNGQLAGWLSFLALPAAPTTRMRPLELRRYLTGLIVAPDLIPASMRVEALWGENEPVLATIGDFQTALTSVMACYNALIASSTNRAPTDGPCSWTKAVPPISTRANPGCPGSGWLCRPYRFLVGIGAGRARPASRRAVRHLHRHRPRRRLLGGGRDT